MLIENNDNDFESGRQWFEGYFYRLEHEATIEPFKYGTRYTCPCCGFPTFFERGGFEICELCDWEDDGQDDPQADEVWGGPNGKYSLSEARTNFKRFLTKHNNQKPSNAQVARSKQAIMESFVMIKNESNPARIAELWQNIFKNERILGREVDQQISAYEIKAKKDQ
jgi:hypothetical protein